MDQVNDLLEDGFILDDSITIRANNSPNFSEAAVFSPLASLSPCVSLTTDGYTFYKMILEPEPPNEVELREFKKRSTSGNDRWYPTSYCVKCKQEEEGRGQSSGNLCFKVNVIQIIIKSFLLKVNERINIFILSDWFNVSNI